MSEFTNLDLRKAREAQKMPRWKLAAAVNVSESTLERWESGETMPHPDEVDRIADALGEPLIWHRWMLSTYDSYRRRYISSDDYSLPVMAMKLRHEMDDVRALQDALERDAIDGHVDDEPLLDRAITELQQMIQAGSELLQRLTRQRKEARP
ncbi:MAG: helix-turn-helix transcriptional regulator [Candidatus Limiplasma sp.]|nr:helix-turn-helix transcriptional regulator [Candidatus Limiplasma sp.]